MGVNMGEPETRRCENCEHAKVVPLHMGVYECHGAPPSVIVTNQGIASVFPPVNANQYCGCWTPRATAVVAAPGSGQGKIEVKKEAKQ